MRKSFSVIVPTYNGGELFKSCLNSIFSQDCKPERVLVIDSSSTDESAANAKDMGARVEIIDKADFDHGKTRQKAFDHLPQTDYLIYMTQDAILESNEEFEKIMSFAINGDLSAVCGRQIPHTDASLLASHARHFNYKSVSHVSTIDDIPSRGLKAAFCSNSFALYNYEDLKRIGGFPKSVIFGEDMYVAARLILAGKSVGYCAESKVYHSHDYTPKEEFKRCFDIGVFHAQEEWLLEYFGSASGEGLKFVLSEIRSCLRFKRPHLVLSVIYRTALKYSAYRLGRLESRLPTRLKASFSLNKSYWN